MGIKKLVPIFEKGKIGYLIHAGQRVFNAVGYSREEPQYEYIGQQRGCGCEHCIFKSVNGGHMVAVADIDFIVGDVIFSDEIKEVKKPQKRTMKQSFNESVYLFSRKAAQVNKGGFFS